MSSGVTVLCSEVVPFGIKAHHRERVVQVALDALRSLEPGTDKEVLIVYRANGSIFQKRRRAFLTDDNRLKLSPTDAEASWKVSTGAPAAPIDLDDIECDMIELAAVLVDAPKPTQNARGGSRRGSQAALPHTVGDDSTGMEPPVSEKMGGETDHVQPTESHRSTPHVSLGAMHSPQHGDDDGSNLANQGPQMMSSVYVDNSIILGTTRVPPPSKTGLQMRTVPRGSYGIDDIGHHLHDMSWRYEAARGPTVDHKPLVHCCYMCGQMWQCLPHICAMFCVTCCFGLHLAPQAGYLSCSHCASCDLTRTYRLCGCSQRESAFCRCYRGCCADCATLWYVLVLGWCFEPMVCCGSLCFQKSWLSSICERYGRWMDTSTYVMNYHSDSDHMCGFIGCYLGCRVGLYNCGQCYNNSDRCCECLRCDGYTSDCGCCTGVFEYCPTSSSQISTHCPRPLDCCPGKIDCGRCDCCGEISNGCSECDPCCSPDSCDCRCNNCDCGGCGGCEGCSECNCVNCCDTCGGCGSCDCGNCGSCGSCGSCGGC